MIFKMPFSIYHSFYVSNFRDWKFELCWIWWKRTSKKKVKEKI